MTEERESVILESGGEKIFGVLHRPSGKGPHPAVLVCHGLAGHKTGKFRVYVDLATRLTDRGIAVFRFDYRGCGDSEGELLTATPDKHVEDAAVCLKYMEGQPAIDNSRIGIFGRSFGGPIAVIAASRFPHVKSLVLWCPMFNGKQWIDQWHLVLTKAVDKEAKAEMMRINGQQMSGEFFKHFFRIDLTEDMAKLNHVPFLHIQGESDTRINLEHAHAFERCRKQAEAESRFIRLPNTDHDFSHYKEKLHALDETSAWFEKTLEANR